MSFSECVSYSTQKIGEQLHTVFCNLHTVFCGFQSAANVLSVTLSFDAHASVAFFLRSGCRHNVLVACNVHEHTVCIKLLSVLQDVTRNCPCCFMRSTD